MLCFICYIDNNIYSYIYRLLHRYLCNKLFIVRTIAQITQGKNEFSTIDSAAFNCRHRDDSQLNCVITLYICTPKSYIYMSMSVSVCMLYVTDILKVVW